MSPFFANGITIQISDTVRLIFQDLRQGVPGTEEPMISRTVGEVILSPENARALRDVLVEHVKDEPKPGVPD